MGNDKYSNGTIVTISDCMGYLVNNSNFWDVCFDLGPSHIEKMNDTQDVTKSELGLDDDDDTDDKKCNFNPNRRFYAIRDILSGRSLVFRAMFKSGMLESCIKNKSTPIQIPDVTPEAFLTILTYMYTGKYKLDITTVFQVLYVSQKYELKVLAAACKDFIKEQVTFTNVLYMLISAYTIHDKDLINFARIFIHKYPKAVVNSKSFLFLPENILKDLVDKHLWLSNEMDIFMAVVRWAYYQLDGTDRLDENKVDDLEQVSSVSSGLDYYNCIGIEMVPMSSIIRVFNTIREQIAHEIKLYNYKPSDRILSLRKFVKSILPLIRFPLMTRIQIIEKVIPEMILDKDQIVQVLVYKSYQEGKERFDIPPHISFPTKDRILMCAFKHETDFDENGLIFWIGSKKKTKKFRNPMTDNLGVVVKTSTSLKGCTNSIVGRDSTPTWTCGGIDEPSFISIDIGIRNKLTPSHYTLKHGHRENKDSIRNWVFQGSDDGKKYYILSIHMDNQSLNGGYATCTFPVIRPTDNDIKTMLYRVHDNHQRQRQRRLTRYILPGYNEWFHGNSKKCTTKETINQLIEETFLSLKRNSMPQRFRYFRIRMVGANSGGCGERWFSYMTVCGIELYGILFSSC